jgi:hypothetical protein
VTEWDEVQVSDMTRDYIRRTPSVAMAPVKQPTTQPAPAAAGGDGPDDSSPKVVAPAPDMAASAATRVKEQETPRIPRLLLKAQGLIQKVGKKDDSKSPVVAPVVPQAAAPVAAVTQPASNSSSLADAEKAGQRSSTADTPVNLHAQQGLNQLH